MDISSFSKMEEKAISSPSLKHVVTLKGLRWTPDQICFSPDGRLLAASTPVDIFDRASIISLWDVSQRIKLRDLPTQKVHHIAFSPDGTLLAIAGDSLSLWTSTGERCVDVLTCNAERIAFSPNGTLLFTIDIRGVVSLWYLASRQVIYSFQALPNPDDWQHEPGVLTLSPDGTSLAVTSAYGNAYMWMLDTSLPEVTFWDTIRASFYADVSFSPDSRFLATLWVNKQIRKPKNRLKHSKDVHLVIRLYDTQSLTSLADIPVGKAWEEQWGSGVIWGEKTFLAFSPDSSLLATANSYGYLSVWDVNEQQLVASLAAHPDPGNYQFKGISAIA